MAPLLHLVLVCALSIAVLASPHASRNLYAHAHRAVAPHRPLGVRVDSPSFPVQRRKRSLNKRCISRPANTTTPASPSAPVNVAPLPSSPHSDPAPSSAPPPSSPPPSSPPPSTPTPTPSPSPSPTTSSPAPAQTSSSDSNSGEPSYLIGTQRGQGTWYSTGLGACGITNHDTDYIAAVSHLLFDSFPRYNGVNPNTDPVCGRQVVASYGGKSVTVTITDRCDACQETDLDLSPSAFGQLADLSRGRIEITWVWK